MKFTCPTTICISGITQSGKTTFLKTLLKYKKQLMDPPPAKVLYCYGAWQAAFEDMKVQFHRDLPSQEVVDKFADGTPCMIVLDDLMDAVVKSEEIQRLFVRGSHHQNITVVYLNQNMFHQGKCSRSIQLNCHYIVLLKNPRDFSQIRLLGRQMGLGKTLVEAYEDCMKEKYNYLVIDLSPHSSSDYKMFSHIFPGEDEVVYVRL